MFKLKKDCFLHTDSSLCYDSYFNFFVFMLELLWMCSDSANNTEYSEYSRVHLR